MWAKGWVFAHFALLPTLTLKPPTAGWLAVKGEFLTRGLGSETLGAEGRPGGGQGEAGLKPARLISVPYPPGPHYGGVPWCSCRPTHPLSPPTPPTPAHAFVSCR